MCSHLCPYSASFFLLAVWSRLWDLQVLWGHKHYRVPHLCPFRHRLVAVSSLHFFLSLPATVLLPGCFWHRILFMTLRGCSMAKDSSCLPFVSILVSLSVPNLSPYFSISIAIQFFSLGAFGQRNLLVSRSSLLSPLLSVLRSGGFGDRTQVPSVFGTRLSTSLSHVAVLSGCFRGTVCSLSSCSLQLVPLLLSLSLAVLLSRCLFGHMILSGSSFVLPCPRLFPPTCILNSFLIAAAAWERTDFLASCVSP